MKEAREVLPRTVALIEKGLEEKLHVGAQLYASLNGTPIADYAVGWAREGVPMTNESMLPWGSTTKATVAVGIGQMWEKGKFDLDDRVCRYIPEFGTKGKEAITIRHILTHSPGFQVSRARWMPPTWEESIASICDAEMVPGWVPGSRSTYNPPGSFILAEIIHRLDGRLFEEYVRDEVFEPLGMKDCWVGMPVERYQAYGQRIADIFDTQGEVPRPISQLRAEAGVTRCIPGGNGRGPMKELVRLFDLLLGRGRREGVRLLSPQTVEALTVCQTYKLSGDRWWGLFLAVDNMLYGRHCSPRTFGHGGGRFCTTFGDPEVGLAVAMVLNGHAERVKHLRRSEAVSTAIYEDLGLVKAGSPGRDHPMVGGE